MPRIRWSGTVRSITSRRRTVMTPEYDAIVVGARCAGSPTAMLLARSGHRVLLLDRATFPSDTLSTHAIHAPGVAALRRWGLLEAVVATGCPPLETYLFDFGPFTLTPIPRPSEASWSGSPPARARAPMVPPPPPATPGP